MITMDMIQLITSIAILGGIIFTIFKFFRDPDIKNTEAIKLINQRCEINHKNIDQDIYFIRENHLKHMEKDIRKINENVVKIFTILEERNK